MSLVYFTSLVSVLFLACFVYLPVDYEFNKIVVSVIVVVVVVVEKAGFISISLIITLQNR